MGIIASHFCGAIRIYMDHFSRTVDIRSSIVLKEHLASYHGTPNLEFSVSVSIIFHIELSHRLY